MTEVISKFFTLDSVLELIRADLQNSRQCFEIEPTYFMVCPERVVRQLNIPSRQAKGHEFEIAEQVIAELTYLKESKPCPK